MNFVCKKIYPAKKFSLTFATHPSRSIYTAVLSTWTEKWDEEVVGLAIKKEPGRKWWVMKADEVDFFGDEYLFADSADVSC